MRRPASFLAVLPVLALAFGLAGCGGSSSSTSAEQSKSTSSSRAEGTVLSLKANPSGEFEFDKTALEAPAGNVTIVMTNPSSVPHDIAIQGNGVDVVGKVVMNGSTSTVTAALKPGTYTFLCTVDSHARNEMEGTLTVK